MLVCVICGRRAFELPNGTFAPGCCRSHSIEANRRGIYYAEVASDPPSQRTPQRTPICRICNRGAWYDHRTGSFSPGCGRTHARQAIRNGHYTLRYV